MRSRSLKPAWGLALALILTACRKDPMELIRNDPSVIAVVGRYTISRQDLDATVAYNQAADTDDPAIRSRIWDRLVEDCLVLNDATQPPAPEVPQPLGPFSDPKAREDMVSSVLQRRVFARVTVSPSQVKAYYLEHPDEFRKGKGVLLRGILLGGQAQVKDVEKLLGKGHSFVDVARLYSLSPEKGAAQYFEYAELPDYLRAVVTSARQGVPTRPIDVSGDFTQILLVEKRYQSYTLPLEVVAPQIRLRLTDAMGDDLTRRYMDGLRATFPVEVFWSKIPFAYQKEAP